MTKLFIVLGKLGDILNILPLLHKSYVDTGEKPRFMVAKEFASVLDGVSYVEPIIFDGPYHELSKAIEYAKTLGGEYVSCQVSGPVQDLVDANPESTGQTGKWSTSYAKEAWRLASALDKWDDNLPLIIDQRSKTREEALLRECGLIKRGKSLPIILLSLNSNSSPFPYADLLRELITLKFHFRYRIVELPKAERIYDLMALYEKAHCLISVDSAPLHLAWACRNLPVFALANDKPEKFNGGDIPWHGSPWKPNHHWYCRYKDFPDRAVEMLEKIDNLSNFYTDSCALHVWSEYKTKREFNSHCEQFPVTKGMCARDSENHMADSKRVPYLKDVIRMAIQKAHNDGTNILLTRPDTNTGNYKQYTKPPFFAYRITIGESLSETFAPIADAFCATRAWWKERLPEIPDLLLSSDYQWSQCLWAIFKQHGATDATGFCSRIDTPPKPFVASKTLEHNTLLCSAYMNTTKIHGRYPKVSEQLECLPLETHKLAPYGYNPAITTLGDGMVMVYRYHTGTLSTKLAIASVGFDGKVSKDQELYSIDGRSVEDARFFKHDGKTCLSFVDSNFPQMPTTAIVRRGEFVGGQLCNFVQDDIGTNGSDSIEKNWVYFTTPKTPTLYCIYQCYPEHHIVRPPESWERWEFKTKYPTWPYGPIRGGTPPVEYEGRLLRFFHSRLENEIGGVRHRYFMGAYLMNPEPPFDVVRVSKRPIAYASEADNLTKEQRIECKHRKPNVIFPSGIVERDGGWLVSVGINDCISAIVRVKPENLNL